MKFKNIFALVGFVALCACSNANDESIKNPPIRNSKPGVGNIVVMGDSLAAGHGADDANVRPAGCLAKAFGSPVTDMAVSGTTSAQILSKADLAQKAQPKLIFVSSGGNDTIIDSYNQGAYPAVKTMSEVDSLFERLLNTGAVVVYLGLNPPFSKAERLPQISALARSKGVIVVDGMADLWNNKEVMSDQIHPNSKGYAIMCGRILKAVDGYYP